MDALPALIALFMGIHESRMDYDDKGVLWCFYVGQKKLLAKVAVDLWRYNAHATSLLRAQS